MEKMTEPNGTIKEPTNLSKDERTWVCSVIYLHFVG